MTTDIFAPKRLFPPLSLAEWRPTRDTLLTYGQVLGKIRRALTPPQPHWSHISLRVFANNITTTTMPMPDADKGMLEIVIRPLWHRLTLVTNADDHWHMDLTGQSARAFSDAVLDALAGLGVHPAVDRSLFADDTPLAYDRAAVETFFEALWSIDDTLKTFKAELDAQGPPAAWTGPVQLWPHHFDHALLWFSGRKIPGVDPADEESADEQMNFGFSTGDEGISDGYFYVTAYPQPDGFLNAPLPEGAHWHTAGWNGAVMMYNTVAAAAHPQATYLEFLRAAHQAGSALMR